LVAKVAAHFTQKQNLVSSVLLPTAQKARAFEQTSRKKTMGML